MKQAAHLIIQAKQFYEGQDPDIISMETDGTMEKVPGGWEISYEESELTGMEGVTTTMLIKQQEITLTRSGRLNSQMVFQQGVLHQSLYQMEFGALLVNVCATQVRHNLTHKGGRVWLTYGIDIEQSSSGVVEYYMDVNSKDSIA